MNRSQIVALACHAVACLLFPIVTILGLRAYTAIFSAPHTRSVAIGLAAELIFIVFASVNGSIALVPGMTAKIIITCALIVIVLFYLLTQHPLRALFFAGISGGLSFSAIYATRRLAAAGKNT